MPRLFVSLLACAGACLVRSVAGHAVYEQSPWTDGGAFVSLETHPDGVTPFVPVPGDGGLCGALTTEVENFTVTTVPGKAPPFVVTEWGHDHYYGKCSVLGVLGGCYMSVLCVLGGRVGGCGRVGVSLVTEWSQGAPLPPRLLSLLKTA